MSVYLCEQVHVCAYRYFFAETKTEIEKQVGQNDVNSC